MEPWWSMEMNTDNINHPWWTKTAAQSQEQSAVVSFWEQRFFYSAWKKTNMNIIWSHTEEIGGKTWMRRLVTCVTKTDDSLGINVDVLKTFSRILGMFSSWGQAIIQKYLSLKTRTNQRGSLWFHASCKAEEVADEKMRCEMKSLFKIWFTSWRGCAMI